MYIIDTAGSPVNADFVRGILPVTSALLQQFRESNYVQRYLVSKPTICVKFTDGSVVDMASTVDLTDEEISRCAIMLAEFLCDTGRTYPIYMDGIIESVRKKIRLPSESAAEFASIVCNLDPVDDALPKWV